jgi:hypothetical protein
MLVIFKSTATCPRTNEMRAFCTILTFFIVNIMIFVRMFTKTSQLKMRDKLKASTITFLYLTKWFDRVISLMTLQRMTTKTFIFWNYDFTLMTYIANNFTLSIYPFQANFF